MVARIVLQVKVNESRTASLLEFKGSGLNLRPLLSVLADGKPVIFHWILSVVGVLKSCDGLCFSKRNHCLSFLLCGSSHIRLIQLIVNHHAGGADGSGARSIGLVLIVRLLIAWRGGVDGDLPVCLI